MKHVLHLCALILLMSGFQANKISAQASVKELLQDSSDRDKPQSPFLTKYPLITWARKSPAEIGCMLEAELGYKDKVFNCGRKNYVNKGDPCKKTKEYYEGVQIPDHLAPKIFPLFKTITLAFEHGALQDMTIEFNGSMTVDKIKELFTLPSDSSRFPDNIMDIRYGDNVSAPNKPTDPGYTRWLEIIGFEHMGSADVDCK